MLVWVTVAVLGGNVCIIVYVDIMGGRVSVNIAVEVCVIIDVST